MSTATGHAPNPGLIFETFNMYQRTAALKAAIELDVFSAIAKGNKSPEEIAKAVGASTANKSRGVRILCDFLTMMGFLSKEGEQYSLGLDASIFLVKSSPGYMGGATRFILDPKLIAPYLDLAEVVRTGKTTLPTHGTVSYDNPIWVEFAEAMGPMQFMAAQEIAAIVAGEGEMTALDMAAGHGLFGIAIAQRNPKARVTALDWADVLTVASENAKKMGVADRHTLLPGDAFTVEYGGPYDVILVTNFFHHFDIPTCEGLIRKISAALKPGGRCVTLDFVPNDDRISPPAGASFAMMMLGTTDAGDAYTFAEYKNMFDKARFVASEAHTLTKSPAMLIVSTKA
jgi:2-polyprenyl-3-methyl-5-hydroxy-6-metoxy-1,4-benzoquinol methylase